MVGWKAGPEEELKKDRPAKFKHSQDSEIQIYTHENLSSISDTSYLVNMHMKVKMLYTSVCIH